MENNSGAENYNFGDILTALLWVPYKNFMKDILNDEKRETILQNLELVDYDEIEGKVKAKDVKLTRDGFKLAQQMIKLFADDIQTTKKIMHIIELYEQGVQLCPPYTNEELIGFAPKYRDDVCRMVRGA